MYFYVDTFREKIYTLLKEFKITFREEFIMDYIIGEIKLFAFPFAPTGWMSCEGQVLPITSYKDLFSLIGTTYGGDGKTSFALPNLKGVEPVPQMKYYIAVQGIYPDRA